jgi:predicted Ser/Thr protein kinase
MSDQWRRVNELFHAALERPGAGRASFVAQQAGENTALRDEVLSLIEAHDRAGQAFLESPAHARDDDADLVGPELQLGAGAALSPGHQVGSYRIERELGRGGMGIVYLAEDLRLGRMVALKALAPHYTHDAPRRERLRKEARAAARLSHPAVATVFALEEIGDELFIACEYVPGRTLREELDAGVMAVERMLQIGAQIARALAAAHAQGVVHRDLKPENVVCGKQGGVKILDFGVARSPEVPGHSPARLTEAGTMVGTPAYMSPEQIDARDVDFRSDIFSFGVLLYELATGVHPFEGTTAASTIGRILAIDPCAPSQLRPLPPEFDRIARKCLQKRPEDRYQSTPDLALDLEELGAGVPAAPGAGQVGGDSEIHGAAGLQAAGAAAGFRSDLGGTAGFRSDLSGTAGLQTGGNTAPGPRWWRVHQLAAVFVYAVMTAFAWLGNQSARRDWTILLFFACVAAAALNGTLRVHLLFTERHNAPAFRGELRRATPWLRGSDTVLGLVLMALAMAVAPDYTSLAILLAAVGAGSIIVSVAVEPATTDAAFPRRSSGVRRKTPSRSRGRKS